LLSNRMYPRCLWYFTAYITEKDVSVQIFTFAYHQLGHPL